MLSDAYRGPHTHSSIRLIGGSALSLGLAPLLFFTEDEKPAHLFQWVGRAVGLPQVRTVGLT